MTFKEWKQWLRELPWILRWFVLVMLLRPLIDSFYFLKEVSPLLSPLYIVGVLTPVLVVVSIIRLPKPKRSKLDKYFNIWSFFVVLSALAILMYDPTNLDSIEYFLKLTLPVYIYYFLRRLIKTRNDLHGLLQTFLYSALFVASIFLYEVLINPIRVVESRGLERIQGSFGDVVSYGIYISFSFLIITYFYFANKQKIKLSKRTRALLIVGGLCVLGLFNIHHVASYIIFGSLTIIFMLYNLKGNQDSAILLILVIGIFIYLFGMDTIEEKLVPLVEKDVAVYQGAEDTSKLLHGRVGRWQKMWSIYWNQQPVGQFIGYPFNFEYAFHYVGVGSHNDYIRMLFFTGLFGLLAYLSLLYQVFVRARMIAISQRYLTFGALIILLLYSISITPTFYPPFMYVIMAIFAYVALPRTKKAIPG